jgi:REP element-mobilizing transposase RayT
LKYRQSIRWTGYDYTQQGAYFVTICTQHREPLFGDVVDGVMQLNACGEIVRAAWLDLPQRFATIGLDHYVVMPNHFHGIVVIDAVGALLAAPWHESPATEGAASGAPTGAFVDACAMVKSTQGRPSLGDVMRAFKSLSGIAVNRHLGRAGQPLWQRNYHDRVIRDEDELLRIRQYIVQNPLHWAADRENPQQFPTRG